MRKFVATAAIAASAAATVIMLPATSQAGIQPAPQSNLFLCANTAPGSAGSASPGGAPVFFHIIPQNATATGLNNAGHNGPALSVGVQSGFCQGVLVDAPGRVTIERLTGSASEMYCGAISQQGCEDKQTPYTEMSWQDNFSSGRNRTNTVQLVVNDCINPSWVAAWTNGGW